MKSLYKSILSLVTLLACSGMSAEAADYETITGFKADTAEPEGIAGMYGASDERYFNLVDGNVSTKWCCSYFTSGYIEFHHTEALYVYGYVLTTGNDNASNTGRNPKSWVLKAKASLSDSWSTIHEVINDNQLQDKNHAPYTYMLPVPTQSKYKYFRLELSGTKGNSNVMQLGEIELLMSDKIVKCNHIKLQYHPALPTTCNSYGTVEYWSCTDCNKTFADNAAKNEITDFKAGDTFNNCHQHMVLNEAVASQCTHAGHAAYWHCEDCKMNFQDKEGTQIIEDWSVLELPLPEGVSSTPMTIGKQRVISSSTAYCTYYKYGGSQSLYLASEIGSASSIKSLKLYCESYQINHTRKIQIWMGEISEEVLDVKNPISSSRLTKVFDGEKEVGCSYGWEEVPFNLVTSFEYSGKNNLLIAIYTPTGSYSSRGVDYACSYESDYRSIYRQTDNDETYADIENILGFSYCPRPIIQLDISEHPADKLIEQNGISICTICGANNEPYRFETLQIEDTHPYIRQSKAEADKLSFTRQFNVADQWEALYLPFSFTYSETEAALYDLAEINSYGVSTDSNGDGLISSQDEKVLLAQLLNTGTQTTANKPYLIRAKSVGEITFSANDGRLYPASVGSVSCGTLKEELTFSGNNLLKQNLLSDGCYRMHNGELEKATSDDETLLPFRWYMQSTSTRIAHSIPIRVRGEHKHIDRNDDGLCDGCDYLLPIPEVTEDNYLSLGLDESYIGFNYIQKKWHLTNAMNLLDEAEYGEHYNFVMLNDIVLNANIFDQNGKLRSGLKEWQGTTLSGCIFDGNGHSIKGLVCTKAADQEVGFFSYLNDGAIVRNLGITDSYLSYTMAGEPSIGAITAGMKFATIQNCWSNATIVTSGGYVGGICGKGQGHIKNCNFSGNIIISGDDFGFVGGIIGYGKKSEGSSSINRTEANYDVHRCEFNGSLVASRLQTLGFGGICGYADGVKINQCLSDGQVSCQDDIYLTLLGGIVGTAIAEVSQDAPEYRGIHRACMSGSESSDASLDIWSCCNKTTLSGSNSVIAGGIIGMSNASVKIQGCLNLADISYADAEEQNEGWTDYHQCYGEGAPSIQGFCYRAENYFMDEEEQQYMGCTDELLKSGKAAAFMNNALCNLPSVSIYSDAEIAEEDKPFIDWRDIRVDTLWYDEYGYVSINVPTSLYRDGEYMEVTGHLINEEEMTWSIIAGNDTIMNYGTYSTQTSTTWCKLQDNTAWYQNIGSDDLPVWDASHKHVAWIQHDSEHLASDGENIDIVEGKDFSSMGRFVARQATYSRQMSNEWGTLCLPFDIRYQVGKASTPYTLYHFHDINYDYYENTVTVKFQEFHSGLIPAGTPMAFRLKTEMLEKVNGKYTFSLKTNNVGVGKVNKELKFSNYWRLNGTLIKNLGNDVFDPEAYKSQYGRDVFYIAQNQFWHAEVPFQMAAFRAWLESRGWYDNASTMRFLIDVFDEEEEMGETTGIQMIDKPEEGTIEFVFDLSGLRHSEPQQGINVNRENKFIVK